MLFLLALLTFDTITYPPVPAPTPTQFRGTERSVDDLEEAAKR